MTLDGKRVLVTGADGVIGSHLVERLAEQHAHVVALSQYNSFNDWGWLEELPSLDQVQVVTGDIRDPHFCLTLCKDVEVIFHLAALIPIPYSYRSPDSYVDTNVRGTLNICQAARANHVEKLIHTYTSEVYGTAQYVPLAPPRLGRTPSPSAFITRFSYPWWWRDPSTRTAPGSRRARLFPQSLRS